MAIGLATACASEPGSEPPPETGPAPDWVASGGKTARFPNGAYLTGFAMVDGAYGSQALDQARERAKAALSERVSLRIQSQVDDLQEDRDGVVSSRVAIMIKSTSDVRLSGMQFEIHQEARRVYALAILRRSQAFAHRRGLREASLGDVRRCLASGERHEQAGRGSDAIATYRSCGRSIASAMEHDAVMRALAPGQVGPEVRDELGRADRQVEERERAIRRRPAAKLSEASRILALQLREQGALTSGRLVVAPFLAGTSDMSSAFGEQCRIELESALVSAARSGSPSLEEDLAVRGTYLESGDEVGLTATVREVKSGRLVASARASLPRKAVPKSLSLLPDNFEEAESEGRLLRKGLLGSGDLHVEVWTDKGSRGVLYQAGEPITIFLRVNQPAWVRLVNVLVSGEHTVLEHAIRIDGNRVNQAVKLAGPYEISPPFGVERVHATAFSRRPPPLATELRTIHGAEYEVVVGGVDAVVRERDAERTQGELIAEALLTVTTTPRLLR